VQGSNFRWHERVGVTCFGKSYTAPLRDLFAAHQPLGAHRQRGTPRAPRFLDMRANLSSRGPVPGAQRCTDNPASASEQAAIPPDPHADRGDRAPELDRRDPKSERRPGRRVRPTEA
jgi:hypothetical protein